MFGLNPFSGQPWSSLEAPTAANLPAGWVQPFSNPVLTRAAGYAIAAIASGAFFNPLPIATAAQINSADKWAQPWSEPVRLDQRTTLRTAAQLAGTVAA